MSIAPDHLYPLSDLDKIGINPTCRFHARQKGVELATVQLGKRKFAYGRDVMRFIEDLAGGGSDMSRAATITIPGNNSAGMGSPLSKKK